MKKSIHPGLGAASLLAIFAIAVIQLSSCGGGGSKPDAAYPALAGSHLMLKAYDSSLGGGSGTGIHPHVASPAPTLTISCPNIDCSPMALNSYKAGTTGADSVAYVIEATTTGTIPANTTLRMEIRMKRDTASPIASGAMKK